MKILNLYAGIGGNRRLWGTEHEITAVEKDKAIADIYHEFFPHDKVVIGDAHQYLLDHFKEFDFIWSSPPCQTHSRGRACGVWSSKVCAKYPDMSLYEEILLLKHFGHSAWVVENVIPYYQPLVKPSFKLGKHLFWSSFVVPEKRFEASEHHSSLKHLHERKGFDLSAFKIPNKRQVLRNCVEPEIGLYVLNCLKG